MTKRIYVEDYQEDAVSLLNLADDMVNHDYARAAFYVQQAQVYAMLAMSAQRRPVSFNAADLFPESHV